MARQRLIDAPPRNDVYVGMLGLTALAMLAGVVVLLLEFSGDYDFEQAPKPGAPVGVPKDFSRPVPKSDGSAPAPAPLTKASPLPAVALPLPAELPPVVATTLPPAVEPPIVAPPRPAVVPETVTPASAPAVVRPGFVPRIPR